MNFALHDPKIRADFERETGMSWPQPKTALDAMIDNGTGRTEAYIEAFVIWATKAIWGSSDGVPDEIWAKCESVKG